MALAADCGDAVVGSSDDVVANHAIKTLTTFELAFELGDARALNRLRSVHRVRRSVR